MTTEWTPQPGGIMMHLCLARPERGRSAPGDQFDCPQCRVVLLDAFRDPADVPEPVTVPDTVRPHLIVDSPGRTVPISLNCPVCGEEFLSHRLSDHVLEVHSPVPQGPSVHATAIDVRWFGIPQTGAWFARCSCGWERAGRWGKAQGPTWAKGQAQAAAETHKQMMEDTDQ